ncbi:MAG: peptidylprolyl isomerase [Ilumatobacteraceae bacterium]
MGTDKRVRKKENRRQRLSELAEQAQRQRLRKRIVRVLIGLALVLALTAIIYVSGRDSSSTTDTSVVDSTLVDTTVSAPATTIPGRVITGVTPCPAVDGSETRVASFEQAPPTCIDATHSYSALVKTNKGDFTIVLDPIKAPLAVNSFVTLARYHFFDGTFCHRAILNFVVQCGDPTATGGGGPGYQFADELPAAGDYKIGSLAMANSGVNTNGSQFFVITGADGASLQPDYTLFGQVTDGLDTTIPLLNNASNPDPAANGVPPAESLEIISVTITEI